MGWERVHGEKSQVQKVFGRRDTQLIQQCQRPANRSKARSVLFCIFNKIEIGICFARCSMAVHAQYWAHSTQCQRYKLSV